MESQPTETAQLFSGWALRGTLAFLALFLLISLALPGVDISQREHIVAVAATPLIISVGLRLAGAVIDWRLTTATLLLALPFLMIKPYFVFPLAALYGATILRPRSLFTDFLPDVIAALTTAVLLSAALLFVWPEWLGFVVALAPVYAGFKVPFYHLFDLSQILLLASLLGTTYLAWFYVFEDKRVVFAVRSLLTCAWAFTLITFMQSTGAYYHRIPTLVLSCLAVGLISYLCLRQHGLRERNAFAAASCGFLSLSLFLWWAPPLDREDLGLHSLIGEMDRKTRVAFISTGLLGWPEVLYADADWVLPGPSAFRLVGMADSECDLYCEPSEAELSYRNELINLVMAADPDIIILSSTNEFPQAVNTDAFFNAHDEFSSFLSTDYHVEKWRSIAIYRKREDLESLPSISSVD